jgi:hypothetical protein
MATRRPVGSLPIAVWAVLQDGRIVGGHPWVAVFWTRTAAQAYLAQLGRGSIAHVVITDFVPVRENALGVQGGVRAMTSINDKLGLRRPGKRAFMANLPRNRSEAAAITSAECPGCHRKGKARIHPSKGPGYLWCTWCSTTFAQPPSSVREPAQ